MGLLHTPRACRPVFLVAFAAVIIFLAVIPDSTWAYVEDQGYEPEPLSNWISIWYAEPVGQEFTPALDRMGWAQFWISGPDSSEVRLQVLVHEGSTSNPVIGSSGLIYFFGGYSGPVLFSFPSAVALAPGTLYVLQLVSHGPNGEWGFWFGSGGYPGGDIVFFGEPDPLADAWFHEGVWASPVQDATWAGIKAMYR